MFITARSYTITQRLHSSEFTLVDKVIHSTDWCPLYRTPFLNVVRMRARSLVPKLKTTVIGLGARLAHVKSRVDQRSVRLVRSLPVVTTESSSLEKWKKSAWSYEILYIPMKICVIVFSLNFVRMWIVYEFDMKPCENLHHGFFMEYS